MAETLARLAHMRGLPFYCFKGVSDGFADKLPDFNRFITADGQFRTIDDQSDPEEGRFLWSYMVTIENKGSETVQLLSRYWHISDATGRVQEMRGPGVVGAQPILEPGQSFQYTSGCPLPTASGAMSGHYDMRAVSGDGFAVEIPLFLLESPHEWRQIH